MTEVFITRGMPATGKTTDGSYKMQYWNTVGQPAMHIERDIVRALMGIKHGDNEQGVSTMWAGMVRNAIRAGMNVALTDTNLTNANFRNTLRTVLKADPNVKIEVKDRREANYAEILERNRDRFEWDIEKWIDVDALDKLQTRLENSLRDVPNGMVQAQSERIVEEEQEKLGGGYNIEPYVVPDDGYLSDSAYIFDIDGTLANHEGVRSPYDLSKVGEDKLHEDVAEMLNLLASVTDSKIIIVSGRHQSARRDTEAWLKKHGIYYDQLVMREHKTRQDGLEKAVLFDKYIRYQGLNILGVFDDRDRVVSMWRDGLKLRCYQVAPGDF